MLFRWRLRGTVLRTRASVDRVRVDGRPVAGSRAVPGQ